MGVGCWAIGGLWTFGNTHVGWGAVDDAESFVTIHCEFDQGISFFDTMENYGAGYSDRILGRAFEMKYDKKDSTFPKDDIRHCKWTLKRWVYLVSDRLESIRDILISDGRTLV
jgi:predicted oxidoreductase